MKKIIKSTKFDNCECNFKLKPKGPKPPRITLNDVMLEIKSIHARLDKVDVRLDKHEAMFKQHGWMK